jgi:hypothetical protein
LFLAVVERIRVLFGERMRTPAEYAGQPVEAIVRHADVRSWTDEGLLEQVLEHSLLVGAEAGQGLASPSAPSPPPSPTTCTCPAPPWA